MTPCNQPHHRHHPLFCALPPYILENIAQNGSTAQRVFAMHNLTLGAQIRGEREAVQDFAILSFATSTERRERIVYTADSGTALPGRIVRREGDPPTGDAAVDEAYDGAGATYDLFWNIYRRNSLDDAGMRLDSTVHFQNGYDNAFWNGQQMVYGDGDEDLPLEQRLFNRFTKSIDIIGHELTHGVIQYTSNLTYYGQSGALNESFADVFGSMVRQRVLGQSADEADWLIGKELITENVTGSAIRSMLEPGTAYDDPVLGKDPQPAHMDAYVETTRDHGGVHINSGIPNRAFALTAVALGGMAWQKAGRIWYTALRDKVPADADFQEAASLLVETARELYGANSLEERTVAASWTAVGIPVSVGEAPPPKDPEPRPKPRPSDPEPEPEPVPTPDDAQGCLTVLQSFLGNGR